MNVPGPLSGSAASPTVAFTPSSPAKASSGPTAPAGPDRTDARRSTGSGAATVVTLSDTARTTLVAQTTMEQTAAEQTAAEQTAPAPSVATKGFATVAQDARAALDARYGELAAKGKPMDYMHATQESWDAVYGGLDRRALFAIASNSGGKFSKDEQNTAQSIMSQQQGQAMMAADPAGNDHAASYRAGIAFLDGVSDEEKASVNWAVQRAAVQFGYETTMRESGREPEKLDSGSPLVRMLKGAMDTLKDKAPRPVAPGGYVNDLSELPLLRDAMNGAKPSSEKPFTIMA